MRSLRSRLIISHILPVLVLIPVIGIAFVYIFETQVILSSYTNELVRQSMLVAEVASTYTEIWFDSDRAQNFVEQIAPQVNANIMLLDPTGRLIVSSNEDDSSQVGQFFNSDDVSDVLKGNTDPHIHYSDSQVTEVLVPVTTYSGRLLGFIRLTNPLSQVFERMQMLRQTTMWVLAIALLVGVVMGSILATDIARPLRKLTKEVTDMATRSKLTPIKVSGPDEIRSLEGAFNSLVERLDTMESSRRRLLANLVHELGRPLGAMHSAVKALRNGADEDPEFRQELLVGMDSELTRLHGLLDELSHLHDQLLGAMDLEIKTVNPEEWINQVAIPWRQEAYEKGLKWSIRLAKDLPVIQIDPDRMAQVLGNLLSNAVHYTDPGGEVQLQADCDQQIFTIKVIDTGPGIHPEEQEKIFNAFFRGKAARRFSDGMGLGLTISRDLVQAHGGKLTIESQPGIGSTFVIKITIDSAP